MINLDSWLELDNWETEKQRVKGVAVIDQCLINYNQQTMASLGIGAPGKTPKKPMNNIKTLTPRSKKPNPKYYKEYHVNVPVAYCPKCRIYVRDTDKGVVCKQCQAYWHYECANTSQEEIDELWSDRDFQCELHRKSVEVVKDKVPSNDDYFVDENLKVRNIKVNNYVLNEKGVLKTKLNDIDKQADIVPKDGERQYTISLSTPTYHLIVENMRNLEKQKGMEIKRDDVDLKGNTLKCQWMASITLNDSTTTQFSITGYHTTNRLLIQLTGKNTTNKIERLKKFAHGTMGPIIDTVEKTKLHSEVKESMRKELTQLVCSKSEIDVKFKEAKPKIGEKHKTT